MIYGLGRDASGLFGNAATAPGRGWHGLRRDAAATVDQAGSTPWRRNRRPESGRRKRIDPVGEGRLREGEGERIFQRCEGRREEILEEFRRTGWQRCVLPLFFGGFRGRDLLAEAAGFFSGECIGNSLSECAFLRIADQHARPRIDLKYRVRAADQVEAAEKYEEVAEKFLQRMMRDVCSARIMPSTPISGPSSQAPCPPQRPTQAWRRSPSAWRSPLVAGG